MFDEMKLLRGEELVVNDKLKIKHPTLEEIYQYGEKNYLDLINLFCLKPYDMMVQLHDAGIDYVNIDNYQLFLMLYQSYGGYKDDCKWLWGDFNFEIATNKINEETVLYDFEKEIMIDRLVYLNISSFIKTINFVSEKNEFNAGNKTARKFLIKEKRREIEKNKNKKFESHLSSLISSIVWNENTKVDLKTVWNLYIYQLYDGFYRINKRDGVKNYNFGIFTGNIDSKKISEDALNWASKIRI